MTADPSASPSAPSSADPRFADFRRLSVTQDGPVLRVWLDRADKRNAHDMTMVEEIGDLFLGLEKAFDVRIVVLGGGTGSPFFTTDPAAVLRAVELKCDAVLKATQVDGIYSADPKKDPNAVRYDRITHDDAIREDLKVMDTAAFALARENRLSILVGSAHAPGAITRILKGEAPATLVTP